MTATKVKADFKVAQKAAAQAHKDTRASWWRRDDIVNMPDGSVAYGVVLTQPVLYTTVVQRADGTNTVHPGKSAAQVWHETNPATDQTKILFAITHRENDEYRVAFTRDDWFKKYVPAKRDRPYGGMFSWGREVPQMNLSALLRDKVPANTQMVRSAWRPVTTVYTIPFAGTRDELQAQLESQGFVASAKYQAYFPYYDAAAPKQPIACGHKPGDHTP